jgi:hypothetical protein
VSDPDGPRLWALSDLHLNYPVNREAIAALPARGADWLILAGDIGDSPGELAYAIETLAPRFARLLWVPGNHELWSRPPRGATAEGLPRGEARYQQYLDLCRERGVLTPEDPWVTWEGPGGPCVIALCFLLYDYSFRPRGVPADGVLAWAREEGIYALDERFLHPDPHPSRATWCAARCAATEARLDALPPDQPLVLVNHWPLRYDLVRLGRVPRYSPWCGTRRTEGWHTRWPVRVVVTGHLHMRATDWKDGVRFEEVSLGYPRHWRQERGAASYLRQILPGPPAPDSDTGPCWRF